MLAMNRLPMLYDDVNGGVPRLSDFLNRVFESTLNVKNGTFTPGLDVSETDKQFEVTVALPGLSKDDIEISLENNVLTISGERKLEEADDREYHVLENHYGSFNRSLSFPDNIDGEKIKARFDNGLLMITIPKLKGGKAKKIKVS